MTSAVLTEIIIKENKPPNVSLPHKYIRVNESRAGKRGELT